ncbi:MAG: DUF1844 domain-containing protein [Candidatus Thermoplasmatota archaeon]|jgi:hypothetical protein|nr:DUF1844 domain-containing protein [Candidatus Thermoplasmatota archaeon]MEC8609017.1 DUF1844 domain-containing protein [Candidatus Thermoplasmatota archaeon]
MFEDKETETFFTVVHMFQRSAMANLGLLEHPTGGLQFNLSEARDIIDILRMLQNKTKGNLDASADAMLKGVISELQMQFMQAPKRKKRIEEEEANMENVRQTFENPRDAPVEDLSSEE